MIALLSKSEQILLFSVKNLAITLLLLAFGVHFGVCYSNNVRSGTYYCSVIPPTSSSADFPLTTPFSTEEESSGMEDDFWEYDDNLLKVLISSVHPSSSICFYYQNSFQVQEFLTCPFTPPKILHS